MRASPASVVRSSSPLVRAAASVHVPVLSFQNGWCAVVCSVCTLPPAVRTVRSTRSVSSLRCSSVTARRLVLSVAGSVALTLSPTFHVQYAAGDLADRVAGVLLVPGLEAVQDVLRLVRLLRSFWAAFFVDESVPTPVAEASSSFS